MPSPGPQEVRSEKSKKRSDAKERKTFMAALGAANGAASRKERADWGDVNPDLLAGFVCAVTRAGGLASFGRSRDGAVLQVTVYADGERQTFWLDRPEGPEVQLEQLILVIEATGDV